VHIKRRAGCAGPPGRAENLTAFNRVPVGRIDVILSGGAVISNYKTGAVSLPPSAKYGVGWARQLPARSPVQGENIFILRGQDVTPPPFFASSVSHSSP
jgi:hypothetical protein